MASIGAELTSFYAAYATTHKKAIFIGYNTLYGSRMYGTLKEVDDSQCLETPVAEGLMTGLAIGYALAGWRPVLCIERHDFLFHALYGIVNHIDKMWKIADKKGLLPIIIRAIVGDSSTLDVGDQHKQNYTGALTSLVKYTPVITTYNANDVREVGKTVGTSLSGAVICIEHRRLYDSRMRFDPCKLAKNRKRVRSH